MPAILSILKAILINLATKYAAELLIKHIIESLKKAASSTESTIDDDVVAVIEKEKDYIVKTINGSLK